MRPIKILSRIAMEAPLKKKVWQSGRGFPLARNLGDIFPGTPQGMVRNPPGEGSNISNSKNFFKGNLWENQFQLSFQKWKTWPQEDISLEPLGGYLQRPE